MFCNIVIFKNDIYRKISCFKCIVPFRKCFRTVYLNITVRTAMTVFGINTGQHKVLCYGSFVNYIGKWNCHADFSIINFEGIKDVARKQEFIFFFGVIPDYVCIRWGKTFFPIASDLHRI